MSAANLAASPAALPIDDDAFAAAMAAHEPFERSPLLAVAVSGGPDSMALIWLADRWARARGGRVFAIIIDHGLRRESADEARTAGDQLEHAGISAEVCEIASPSPQSGVQTWARDQRYRLLRDRAQAAGALHLLLAHHLDDQAETVLLRLARGSGVKGLSAIRATSPGPDVRLLRPLLDFPKARLAATARATGWTIADDPSNRAPKYARTRVRTALAAVGGDAQRLARTASALASDDVAIENAVAKLAAIAASISPYGVVTLDRKLLVSAPTSVSARLLERATCMAAGNAGPIRRSRIERLLAEAAAESQARRTCGGAIVSIRGDAITLCRELAKTPAPAPVTALRNGLWDGRFRLSTELNWPQNAAELHIGPLGYTGLRTLENSRDAICTALLSRMFSAGLTRQAIAGLPAITKAGGLAGLSTFEPPPAADGPITPFCDIRHIPMRFVPAISFTVTGAC